MPQYRKGDWKNVFELDECKSKLFTSLHHDTFVYHMDMSLVDIVERVFTKSYISVLSEEEKEKLRPRLRNHLLASVPEFQSDYKASSLASYQHVSGRYCSIIFISAHNL